MQSTSPGSMGEIKQNKLSFLFSSTNESVNEHYPNNTEYKAIWNQDSRRGINSMTMEC